MDAEILIDGAWVQCRFFYPHAAPMVRAVGASGQVSGVHVYADYNARVILLSFVLIAPGRYPVRCAGFAYTFDACRPELDVVWGRVLKCAEVAA
ncbi:MAG: hypothetical protein QM639_13770 [Rhodocyclaceae bacterium]